MGEATLLGAVPTPDGRIHATAAAVRISAGELAEPVNRYTVSMPVTRLLAAVEGTAGEPRFFLINGSYGAAAAARRPDMIFP